MLRPDSAAFYLPLVLSALIASIICLAARRFGHGFAMLTCVLLMPGLIVESVALHQLSRPIEPPAAGADRRSRLGVNHAQPSEDEVIREVNFLDESPTLASPPCRAPQRNSSASSQPPNCEPQRH